MADTFLTETLYNDRKKKREQTPSPPKVSQERHLESDMEKNKRLWEWTLKKISFTPPTEDYYSQYPIKPGIHFYRALALSKTSTESLTINLPESIMCFDQTQFLMYTDPYTGVLKRQAEVSYSDFESRILDYNDQYIKRFGSHRSFDPHTNVRTNMDGPFLINRGATQQDFNMSKGVLTFRQQKERKVQLENNKLEQRFIVSRAMRATILRLVYFTKNSKSTTANYGYRIMNFRELYDPNPKKSLTNKTTINTEEQNSFTVQNVKGPGLLEYERMSEQLVHFLERNYPVRIKMDPEGRIWVINMKAIQLETAISMNEIQGMGEGKKTLDQLTCSVYCKLCGIIFKKDDASKVLTYKLLWELVQHLKKRNKYLTNIKVSHSSTRPCRVCDVCYMLVVGEHELVEIEQKFAMAQNIPLGDAVIRVPMDSKPKHRPALLSEKLYQWRLLLYFNGVTDLKGNEVNDLTNLWVQYKLHQYKTAFKTSYTNGLQKTKKNDNNIQAQSNKTLKTSLVRKEKQGVQSQKQIRFNEKFSKSSSNQHSPSQGHTPPPHDQEALYSLKMNVIRVHYFFSETIDIEKFLLDTEIKMRLTNGQEWSNYLAEGSTKSIHHFKNKLMGGQRHSAQVLMFFENNWISQFNNNSLYQFCDGMYNTGKLNLYKYNNIYFPDENYYNCNPFPPEWMEMFDPQSVNLPDSYIEQAQEIEAYSPKCTPDELNKMIDFNKYKEQNKYKHVASKISIKRDIKSAMVTNDQITNQLLPINKTTVSHPVSGIKSKRPVQGNHTLQEIDEQFLLQQYIGQDEMDAEEAIFKEENRGIVGGKKQITKEEMDVYKQYDIYDQGGESDEEDQEINYKLNKDLEKIKEEKPRQTRSAQQLPPKPIKKDF